MKKIHFTDIAGTVIDNDMAKKVTGRVALGKNDGASNFCMRVFSIAPGGHTPLHSHAWEHEVFVHQGEGVLLCAGETTPVSAGMALLIPGGDQHQFSNTSKEDFTFVCLIPAGAPEL